MDRRSFIGTAVVAAASALNGPTTVEGASNMYGLIGKVTAVPGERDALIEILLEGAAGMPGCLSYVVAKDAADGNAIWITEVWETREHHEASLELPSVQEAIRKGRPLIGGFEERIVTTPVGGQGLAAE